MLISIEWLRRYVDVNVPPATLAERLTMTGFPVAGAERLSPAPGRAREDIRLDVEITSNRPDLQSHLGIAREVAGLLGVEVGRPEIPALPLSDECFDVAVEAPDLCPLYTARVIRGVSVGPSPDWLVRLLEAAGQRSINNVVDVTNFVLLECGHPLHAFDLSRLHGARLVARRAAGEAFTSIDGTQLRVGADELVIADAEAPVALAGVMGGLDSEVSQSTTDVVLECAVFAPLAIRRASRAHQLRTESSFRFERFVDQHAARWASDRAAALLVEICGAREVGPVCAAGPAGEGGGADARVIALRTAQVERILGIPVREEEIRTALAGLGLVETPDSVARDGITAWDIPTWRRSDLVGEIDLIEEVARRIGFDRIPDAVRIPVRPLPKTPRRDAILHLRDALAAAGLRECCTEPFVGEGPLDVALLAKRPALRVENPMRHDESLLRRSLLGPLLRVVRGNASRGVHAIRLFEIAPVYLRGASGEETEERLLASVVLSGTYADVAGVLRVATEALGLDERITLEADAPPFLARDRCATVRLDDDVLGHVGELAPRSRRAFGIDSDVAVLELRADLLAARARLLREYRPVSRFPAVERDLAFVLDEQVTWGALAAVVRDAAGELLADLRPFDAYRGPQLGRGKKSVALRMEFRALDRTLTGDQADDVVRAVVVAVSERVGGVLRA